MKVKTYVKMLARSISDEQLSMLLSACEAGHVGHTDFCGNAHDEPCSACVFDVVNDMHTLAGGDRPGCLEPDCTSYRACTVEDVLRYLENNPRGT